ncbi:MAG TPA: DUF4181 domain-containing protein [Bacilli bacterium]|nr:DUF4181 domain-containing protein [Bacilli bacterium]
MTVITFFLILVLLVVFQFIIKRVLAKKFELKKLPSGTGRFVNNQHQKIDLGLSILFLILFLLFTMTDLVQANMFDVASPYIIFPVLFIIMELIRAWFQWNKTDQPKRAYITLMNVSILVVLIIFYYLYVIFYI